MSQSLQTFISEAIQPVIADMDSLPMQTGAPGFPRKFKWRGRDYKVDAIVKTWSERSPCKHGSRELYARKHWHEVTTACGHTMHIYFERQMRSASSKHKRWWLHSVSPPADL